MVGNENIKKYIIKNIIEERWKEETKIPSIGFFEIKFKQSRNTIKKILNEFVKSHILYSIEKKGYFVDKNIFMGLVKRESKTDGCDSFVVDYKQTKNYLNIEELRENAQMFNNKIHYSKISNPIIFTKLYFNSNNSQIIKKVSFSILGNEFNNEPIDLSKPLYVILMQNNINITSCFYASWTKTTKDYPDYVANKLKIKLNQLVLVKYIIIIDENNNIIHANKIFINPKFYNNVVISRI